MQFDKKNIKIILGLIIFGLVLWAILYYFGSVVSGFKWILSLLVPFIVGGCLAFIVNIPMSWFERMLFAPEKIKGKKFLQKIKEPVSMLLALILVLAVVAVTLIIIVPQLVDAISTISEKVPQYVSTLRAWAADLQEKYPQISSFLLTFSINLDTIGAEVVDFLKEEGLNMLGSTFTAATSAAGSIVNFLIGVVFCIYCLLSKYKLFSQFRRILYAFNKEAIADEIMRILRMASASFSGFITGQCVEAVICAVLYSLAFAVFRLPYAIMIGVTIGVFSLIPIVGAIIGFIIGALLVFLDDPVKLILFAIVYIVVQQIESNMIYPKVVGNKVGLPSMWVLAAVIIGGNAFGIVGMVLMIPLCAVIYALIAERVSFNLEKKHVPEEKLAEPVKPEKKKRKKEEQRK